MVKQIILTSILVLDFASGFSKPGEILRRKLEADFNLYEASELYVHNFDSARSYLHKIINGSEKAELWDLCMKALNEMAYISDKNYRFDLMKEAVEKGQKIQMERSASLDSLDPMYDIRGNFTFMIGTYYRNNGEFNKALEVIENLIQRLKTSKINEKKVVFNAYAYMADLYMKMGKYDNVYVYYLLAGKSIPEGNDQLFYTYLHSLYLGAYFYRIKNYVLAKSYYTGALKKAGKINLFGNFGDYLISNYDILALIYQSLNQRDSAFICLNKSLALQNPDNPDIAWTYEYYGDCLFSFGDYPGAIAYYRRIYEFMDRGLLNVFKAAQILSKIGESYHRQSNFPEALKNYQLALGILSRDPAIQKDFSRNPELIFMQPDKVLIRLLILKSEALYEQAIRGIEKMKFCSLALSTYLLSMRVIEDFRLSISTDDFKEFFVTDLRKMYENAMKTCFLAYEMSQNDSIVEMAFYIMEKSKNQVLLDAIRSGQAIKNGNIPNSLVNKESQYKNKLVQLQNRLYKLKFKESDLQIENQFRFEIAKTQTEYTKFLEELEKKYPGYYHMKYSSVVPSIKEIQHYVKNRILIEYMLGEKTIALIAFNGKKTIFRLLALDSGFNFHLDGLLHDLSHLNPEERSNQSALKAFIDHAAFLYSRLLEPVFSDQKGNDELILVPDGRLCFLPFEVLISKVPDNPRIMDYKNLDYVLKHYTLRYEYSSELFKQRHQPKERASNRSPYNGFAPGYERESRMQSVEVLGRSSALLMPLKFSRNEIEEAAAIFSGTAFTGKNANVRTFKESVSARIIHFAGHTIINDSIPELSGMFFSGTGFPGKENSGEVLYLNEIVNLNLNSRLAILSACETGSGKLLKGEGLISIGRAFKYAGCPNLVMSLWKINDRSASEIMKKFCQNLKRGDRTDAALRKAKLYYLDHTGNDRRTHPFYWSAFIMIGNNENLFRRNYTIPLVAGLMVVLVLGVFWYKRKGNVPRH